MELNARDILREKKIYTSMSGKTIDVTLTPYAVQTLYEEFIANQAEIIGIMKIFRGVIDELQAGKNVDEHEKTVARWQQLRKDNWDMNWRIIGLVLKMNGGQYTVEEAKEFLAAEEVPHLIQFIMGLDDDTKKNVLARAASSSAGGGRTGKRSRS